MFKRMFQFSSSENDTSSAAHNGPSAHTLDMAELSSALQREAESSGAGSIAGVGPVLESFDDVYTADGIKPSTRAYTILKVAAMLNSRHLAEMAPEAKRSSLMMALEAAAVEIGELLQDAVNRNRALDAYESERIEQIKNFEAVKAEENNRLHAELEKLTGQYMARIQNNSDQVAQEQDNFRSWQKRKQQESQRITDAASFCVPQGNSPNGNAGSLSVVLERINMPRR
jgi:hypothetical protein